MRTTCVPIHRVAHGHATACEDQVAVEEPLTLRVNGATLSVTMRTPGEDDDLALGFLYGEGLIERASDVLQVRGGDITLRTPLSPTPRRHFPTHAACGVCGRDSLPTATEPPQRKGGPLVSRSLLPLLSTTVRAAQSAFDATGGLHAAGLFASEGPLLCLREDIGRHNAVDKVVGWALQAERVPLTESLLFVTGRVSYELVQKAARAGIPVLVAVGAPSSLAVAMCQEADITLVGFLRSERFNTYSGEWRLVS